MKKKCIAHLRDDTLSYAFRVKNYRKSEIRSQIQVVFAIKMLP